MLNQQRKEAAPPGFVTRRGLCEKVGLTDAQFRTLTACGVILSDGCNPSGYALYTDATVKQLVAMKSDGSLVRQLAVSSLPSLESDATAAPAAPAPTPLTMDPTMHYTAEDGVRVFELLRDGRTLEEIILTTRIHPHIVKAIRVDYDDITGSIHLGRDLIAQLNQLGDVGTLPGAFPLREPADVLSMVKLCALDRTCSTCNTNAALSSCEECLVKERRAALRTSA